MRGIAAALLLGLVVAGGMPDTANAAGCLKGAAIGGVAGHMAGHGALGAAAGCAVGHHEASKDQQAQQAQNEKDKSSANTTR